METKDSAINRAMAAEIKAERTAQGMTAKELAEKSGVPSGTLNRMTSNDIRDINITQMSMIANALGLGLPELVERAEARAARIEMSQRSDMNVFQLRPKQVEDMTVEEIESIQRYAANRDPEADEDEHFD